jgi:hypothetical protein
MYSALSAIKHISKRVHGACAEESSEDDDQWSRRADPNLMTAIAILNTGKGFVLAANGRMTLDESRRRTPHQRS